MCIHKSDQVESGILGWKRELDIGMGIGVLRRRRPWFYFTLLFIPLIYVVVHIVEWDYGSCTVKKTLKHSIIKKKMNVIKKD